MNDAAAAATRLVEALSDAATVFLAHNQPAQEPPPPPPPAVATVLIPERAPEAPAPGEAAAGEDVQSVAADVDEWLVVSEKDELPSFEDCQSAVLRCADLISRKVTDDESLATQLTSLAKLHYQLQQASTPCR